MGRAPGDYLDQPGVDPDGGAHWYLVAQKTGAVMAVYVDDLLLAAGKHAEARFWKKVKHHVKFGESATPNSKFLGGHH